MLWLLVIMVDGVMGAATLLSAAELVPLSVSHKNQLMHCMNSDLQKRETLLSI